MRIIRCGFVLLSELQLGGIMDDALQTHDVLTGHIHRFCFASTTYILGRGFLLNFFFGTIEVRYWNFFRYSIVLKIRY
jgi:hypothetical protein